MPGVASQITPPPIGAFLFGAVLSCGWPLAACHPPVDDELLSPLSSHAYLEVLYRQVLAWSRRDPTFRVTYRSERDVVQRPVLEYQVRCAGKSLHEIAANGLDRAYSAATNETNGKALELLVEYKNWSSPVGASEFQSFAEKVRNRARASQFRVGIFVARNGVTKGFMR